MIRSYLAMTMFAFIPGFAVAQTVVTQVKDSTIPVYDAQDHKLGTATAAELLNRPVVATNPDGTRYQVKTDRGIVFVRNRDVTTNGPAITPPPPNCGVIATRSPGGNMASNGLSGKCTSR